MRHLAEARRPPKAEVASSVAAAVVVCLLVSTQRGCRSPYVWNSLDFRAVVLLGFAMVSMLTWFRPLDAAPAAGPRLTDTYCSLSLSLSCMAKEKLTQSVCLEKGVKWLHSVSSSDSFISKPGARQEVPPRGVSNSDLVYGLFYLNNSLYITSLWGLYMNSAGMDLRYCISTGSISFSGVTSSPLQKVRQ